MKLRESQLPEPVRLRAQSQGEIGKQWLAALDDHVASLEDAWSIRVGAILTGGSESLVANAECSDGMAAVLKIGLPGSADLSTEAKVYRLAAGHGYATFIAHDNSRNALLLERLGTPLGDMGFPIQTQMELLCTTLQEAWIPIDPSSDFMTGAEKARWLATFITDTWQLLDQPCDKATIDCALSFAEEREDAFSPDNAVLVHGDSHAHNALAVPERGQHGEVRYKFVDPDGFLAEKAYDLAMQMRDWNDELLEGDALTLGHQRCDFLSELTAVDEHAIWQWGFIERVSTGLVMLQIGMKDEGGKILAVADRWRER